MESLYWQVLLLLVLSLALSPSVMSRRLRRSGSWLRRLGSTLSSRRSTGTAARLARLEKQIAALCKVSQCTLSRVTSEKSKPKGVRHGKLARDVNRKSDIVYRLALGSPRINHADYSEVMAMTFIKGVVLSKRNKALAAAASYASRIPEDQEVRVYCLSKGKPGLVTTVKGRRSKVKGMSHIGYARIIWQSEPPIAAAA